ncbi:MAG: M48 family metallopeptidase [Phycisphaerales bacterium]|nr:M48 family metallopeptidase [Phycisphaerales bacterium]
MAINFFAAQAKAKKKTGRLVILFGIAVGLIIAILYVIGALILGEHGDDKTWTFVWWQPGVLLGVGLFTLVVVGGGSFYKLAELSQGGDVVARSLGGKQLDPSTRNTDERRVLNVVEEMAIASGIPVPPVYLIDDPTINAFAAGYHPKDAVIGVTSGCVQQLNREELQGVMAHEFSHIFNGDMRLSIRLMGVIYGLLVLGLFGLLLVRTVGYGMMFSRRSNNKDSGQAALAIIGVGIVLMVLGFIGTFFGRVIQAAVSRQREYLADATAVQYTRNPNGIGGALRKIGGLKAKTTFDARASEMNHMFFTQAMSSMFSTHPPIADRISRIEGIPASAVPTSSAGDVSSVMDSSAAAGFAGGDGQSSLKRSQIHQAVEGIGSIDMAHINLAHEIIEAINPVLRDAAHEPFDAQVIVFCLLLSTDKKIRAIQYEMLEAAFDKQAIRMTVDRLEKSVAQLDERLRLPLLDLAIPSLCTMSPPQHQHFRETVSKLIRADQSVSRFEWAVHVVLARHLDQRIIGGRASTKATHALKRHHADAVVVLATLAYLGAREKQAAELAFRSGLAVLGGAASRMPAASECGLDALDTALGRLDQVKFSERQRFLLACEACIAQDGRTTVAEAETLRAIADAINCPMPPILQEQQAAKPKSNADDPA